MLSLEDTLLIGYVFARALTFGPDVWAMQPCVPKAARRGENAGEPRCLWAASGCLHGRGRTWMRLEHSYASVVAAQRFVQACAPRNERHDLHKHLFVLFAAVPSDSLRRQVLPKCVRVGVDLKSQRRM